MRVVVGKVVAGAAAVALLLAGCGDSEPLSSDEATTTTLAEEVAPVVLGPDADGTTQELAVGGRILLELPVNGGTGYSWEVTEAPAADVVGVVDVRQARDEPVDPEAPTVGAAETVTIELEALGAGTTTVVVSLLPPGGGPAEDTVTLQLVVA